MAIANPATTGVGGTSLANLPFVDYTTSPSKYTPATQATMQGAYSYAANALKQGQGSQQILPQDLIAGYGYSTDANGNVKYNAYRPQSIDYSLPSLGNYEIASPTLSGNYSIGGTNNLPTYGSTALPNIPNAQFSQFNFDPIEQQARASFEQQTVPGLAERFTGMGAGASGSAAFARNMGSAAAGLESSLASLKAQLLPQWEMQQAQYGLSRAGLGMQGAQIAQQDTAMQYQRDLSEKQLGLQKNTYEAQMQMQKDLSQAQMQQQSSLAQAQMNYERDIQNAQLQAQQAQMQLQERIATENFALQQSQALMQQQQNRTTQLLGLLGFAPPQQTIGPVTTQVQNPSFISARTENTPSNMNAAIMSAGTSGVNSAANTPAYLGLPQSAPYGGYSLGNNTYQLSYPLVWGS